VKHNLKLTEFRISVKTRNVGVHHYVPVTEFAITKVARSPCSSHRICRR